MKVEWTYHANWQKQRIADYIRVQFGYRHKRKFMQDVDNSVRMLMHNPNIGKLDPLFSDRSIAYRSIIINGRNKMVYRVDDEIIYIAGFWDTRMDDEEQAAKVQ